MMHSKKKTVMKKKEPLLKKDLYQVGGQMEQPTKEELEEFQNFVALLVRQGKVRQDQLTEEFLIELFKMFREQKKKKGSTSMFAYGGTINENEIIKERFFKRIKWLNDA